VRHPRLMRICELTDSWVAECPGLRLFADHVLVQLERTRARLETPER
jgi:hypothetical protein